MSKTTYAMAEMESITRQATTNKQVEILFKFSVVLSPGDIFVRRKYREILNSLKFMYSSGGDETTTKTNITFLAMIMSFVEITYKEVKKMSSIARRVSSLRLVTDLR